MAAAQPVDVRDLAHRERRRAVRVLTDAFLDDPAWIAIGPDRVAHRRLTTDWSHRSWLTKADRFGGRTTAALREGRLAGVAVTFDSARWPPPEPWSTMLDFPAWLLSGVPAAARALAVDGVMDRAHPSEPHHYLWLLAVDPPSQRSGVGRALLGRVIADAGAAELPVYLETATPENVAYYRNFGFEVTGEAALPRGATMWFMERPAGGPAR